MKLDDIQSVRDAAQNNLVISYIESVRGGKVFWLTFIISDVRPLSLDEFKKLTDLSFEQYQLRHLFMAPGHRLIDRRGYNPAWNEWEKGYGDDKVTTIKWKELVAKMKAEHPVPTGDDFDE